MHSYIHYYPQDLEQNYLEWTLRINQIPQKGYWFFALTYYIESQYHEAQVGGYAGLQLVNEDKKAIFSLWQSEKAEAYGRFIASDIQEDGNAKRILGLYDWHTNEPYRFHMEFGESDITLVIYDKDNTLSRIGKQTLPNNFTQKNLSPKVDLFVEWFSKNEPTKPIEVTFSNFSPYPKALIADESNTLNSLIKVSDNYGSFVFS